jgi:hypothetical protein
MGNLERRGRGPAGPAQPSARPRAPRWVRVLAGVGALLATAVVVLLLAGHGPDRHVPHGLSAGHSAEAGPR